MLARPVHPHRLGRPTRRRDPPYPSPHPPSHLSFAWLAQLFDDPPRQSFIDLVVARHRLIRAGLGIAIPIVLRAVPNQDRPSRMDPPDELNPLHANVRSATWRTPGNSPLVRSAWRSRRCSFEVLQRLALRPIVREFLKVAEPALVLLPVDHLGGAHARISALTACVQPIARDSTDAYRISTSCPQTPSAPAYRCTPDPAASR